MCSSFERASQTLCNSLAAVGRRLCTSVIDPIELMAFVACQLIPLDKKPGVRPIGIGDVPRRILAKAILYIIGNDIQLAAGALQTCAGQNTGAEAAVHAMKNLFEKEDTEAVLLVDADNAFNRINCQAAQCSLSIIFQYFTEHLWHADQTFYYW